MGQKVHPIGLRVGIIRDWDAKWYAEKDITQITFTKIWQSANSYQKELADASVSTIEIERAANHS